MRYLVTVQFYIHADSDEDAKRQADQITFDRRKKYDDHCQVVGLLEQPFGKLGNRRVFDVEN